MTAEEKKMETPNLYQCIASHGMSDRDFDRVVCERAEAELRTLMSKAALADEVFNALKTHRETGHPAPYDINQILSRWEALNR